MNKTTISRHIGEMATLTLLFFSNAAFADDSDDRLNAYKGNLLLPANIQVATITSTVESSGDVIVFTPSLLNWNVLSKSQANLVNQFKDWTKEDFENFFNSSEYQTCLNVPPRFAIMADEAGFTDVWNYLSQLANGHMQSENISQEEALASMQERFMELFVAASTYDMGNGQKVVLPAFPCEGLDFSGLELSRLDLSNCVGLTSSQLMNSVSFANSILPKVDFSGVDLSNYDLGGVDFSNCTGLTADQLVNSITFTNSKLPAIDFTGISLADRELDGIDFSKCTGLTWDQFDSAYSLSCVILPEINLAGADFTKKWLAGVDFSRCTGLTGAQLKSAANISNIYLSSAQFEAVKDYIPNQTYVYVDGNGILVTRDQHFGENGAGSAN